MLKAIGHALTNLANFDGRDARQAFWYYVLFLVIINMAVSFAMTIPMMVSSVEMGFRAAQSGMTEEQLNREIMASMAPQMRMIAWIGLATNIVTTLLLAASFVRRLHDSDRSGWWAVVAVAAQLGASVFTITQMDRMQDLTMATADPENLAVYFDNQLEVVAMSLVGWIAPVIVVIFGVMKSTDGPNRYGDAPFTA